MMDLKNAEQGNDDFQEKPPYRYQPGWMTILLQRHLKNVFFRLICSSTPMVIIRYNSIKGSFKKPESRMLGSTPHGLLERSIYEATKT